LECRNGDGVTILEVDSDVAVGSNGKIITIYWPFGYKAQIDGLVTIFPETLGVPHGYVEYVLA
jgi:hypothetical protein